VRSKVKRALQGSGLRTFPTGLIYIPSPTTSMTNALLKINMTNRTVAYGVRKVYGG
jgi:hypothetical protein